MNSKPKNLLESIKEYQIVICNDHDRARKLLMSTKPQQVAEIEDMCVMPNGIKSMIGRIACLVRYPSCWAFFVGAFYGANCNPNDRGWILYMCRCRSETEAEQAMTLVMKSIETDKEIIFSKAI